MVEVSRAAVLARAKRAGAKRGEIVRKAHGFPGSASFYVTDADGVHTLRWYHSLRELADAYTVLRPSETFQALEGDCE